MRLPRYFRFLVPAAVLCAISACKNNDTTTAPGALASITINAPDSAGPGESFTIDVTATNVGVAGVHNGHVTVTLPPPLTVSAVDDSPGTSSTFSNGAGASVSWTLNTLDSNTSSTLHVHAMGTLPPGSAAQTLTVQATLVADGITAGAAVAQDTVQLNP